MLVVRAVEAAWRLTRSKFNNDAAATGSGYVYAITPIDSTLDGGLLEDLDPYCTRHRYPGAQFANYPPDVRDVAA